MYHSTIKGFKMQSGLYIVGTPIGNLSDMSPRAIEVLKSVDLVAAEDTRVFGKLAHHFDIKTKSVSCHEHNEREVVDSLVEKMLNGAAIATVSDAGMPGVSDPGFRLIRAARAARVPVFVVPGATAAISALVLSGFPTDRFRQLRQYLRWCYQGSQQTGLLSVVSLMKRKFAKIIKFATPLFIMKAQIVLWIQ